MAYKEDLFYVTFLGPDILNKFYNETQMIKGALSNIKLNFYFEYI